MTNLFSSSSITSYRLPIRTGAYNSTFLLTRKSIERSISRNKIIKRIFQVIDKLSESSLQVHDQDPSLSLSLSLQTYLHLFSKSIIKQPILPGFPDRILHQVVAIQQVHQLVFKEMFGLAASLSKKDSYVWALPLSAVLGLGVGGSNCYRSN